jgi:hypothetical protein
VSQSWWVWVQHQIMTVVPHELESVEEVAAPAG